MIAKKLNDPAYLEHIGAALDRSSLELPAATPTETLPDPVSAYLDGLKSPRSRSTMEDALKRAARAAGFEDGFSGWAMLRPDQFTSLRRRLSELHRPATVSLSLSALRGVLKVSWRMGLIDHERYARVVDWGTTLRGSRLPAGRYIKPDEMQKINAHVSTVSGPHGALVRGCLGAMLGGGLRAFEVCGLVLESYDPVEQSLRLVGKGDKEAVQPLQSAGARTIDEWLTLRGPMKASAPWLFLRVKRERAARAEMLTVKWMEHMCLSVANASGVETFSPHDCRRTYITSLLESGVDLATVQRLARHESSATTARYDRRQATMDAAAARRAPAIFDPYAGRSDSV